MGLQTCRPGVGKIQSVSSMLKGITGNVLNLGLVSFLTDVSSEMFYPLLRPLPRQGEAA
jgi:hypothetical protein